MKTMSDQELLRMINEMRTPRGMLSDSVALHGVSVWTFFQTNILDDLHRIRNEDRTTYHRIAAVPFSRKAIRSMRVVISMLSSVLFFIRWLFRRSFALILVSDQLTRGGTSNPRLTEVYAWLNAQGASYADVVHTTYDQSFIGNLKRRPAGVLYLDAFRILARMFVRLGFGGRVSRVVTSFDFSSFPSEYQGMIRAIVSRYYGLALESTLVIRMLSAMLRIIRPNIFLTIDDVRNHNEFLVASHAAGIPSVVFQHANFGYFEGSDSLPPEKYPFGDFFVVWNRYWAEQLPRMSAQFALHRDRIVIGGRANAAVPPANHIHPPLGQKPLRILVPYEASIPQKIARTYITALRNCPDVMILFSLRAGTNTPEQLSHYGMTEQHPNVEVGSSFDLARIDAAIGLYSTFLDDLVMMGVPVGVVHAGYETFEDLSAFGLAASLTPETLCTGLTALAQLPVEERERRRRVLIDEWGNLDTVLSPFLART